jgi:deoxycytidylate deaminase
MAKSKKAKTQKKVIKKEKRGKSNGMIKAGKIEKGNVIILGFTGSIGSGVTFVSKGFKQHLGENGRYFELSKYITNKLKKERETQREPTIKQKQDYGNKLRYIYGNSVLVNMCLQNLRISERKKSFTDDTIILIDGIRNDGEVRSLRAFPNFYLVSVHANEDVRINRLVGDEASRRLFDTKEEFKVADERDRQEDKKTGQQVNKCNYLADIIINNDDIRQDGTDRKRQFFSEMVEKYIPTMKAIREGKRPPDHPPAINEILMTMAYGMSQRSSCEKRKVGAIIAYISEYKKLEEKIKRPEDNIRFKIVSSGYNEVPLGTDPCKLGQYGMCYRDHIKRQLAKEIKFCPNCGKKIPTGISASFKKFSEYKCSKCKTVILEKYLPGRVKSAGRLLDICRALHGEETAILGLEKVIESSQEKLQDRGKLILYTTTFPCNLCANKIVEAGIKCVYYSEPYAEEESKNILVNAGVDVIKFEGVKSTAYFRLYS